MPTRLCEAVGTCFGLGRYLMIASRMPRLCWIFMFLAHAYQACRSVTGVSALAFLNFNMSRKLEGALKQGDPAYVKYLLP